MQITKALFVIILSAILVSSLPSTTSQHVLENSNTGPFVDKLVYKVIEGEDQNILALINDQIDIVGGQIDPIYLPQLDADADIETSGVLRNGYGQLVINCDKFPLNLTSFRRALAYALDKNAISAETWSGESYPLDSPIPMVNPWSIEGLLPYSYYTDQTSIGNQLLDVAGFADIDADGYREAPDGSDFDITVEVAASSSISMDIGDRVAAALTDLYIDATSSPTDFYSYLSRVNLHGDFDIVQYGQSFSGFGVQWLETMYGSDYYGVDYFNPANFRNATYDYWLPQLLHSTTYEDVYEAAAELQRILIFQCPIIVLYENIDYSAYRTDVFENHVADVSENIPSFWTNLKVRKKAAEGGPFGGTLRISLGQDVDTFNFMTVVDPYSHQVLENTELSLMKRDSNGLYTPWLADSVITETHAENVDVPTGHTRFTFDLLQNATWSDGVPVTGSDVAFSINYYHDGLAYGNPLGAGLGDLASAYSPTPFSVVIEFDTESYWHFERIATLNIIPEHIFSAIGVSGWSVWNPVVGSDPFVTASPFKVTDYAPGEFVELTYSEDFFYSPVHVSDSTDPMVVGPLIVMFVEDETGYEISWNLTDAYPASYAIYKDDLLYKSGLWNETTENVTISLDGTPAGIYDFTLYAYDLTGNSGSWSVLVMVLDIVPPTIDHPPDLTFHNGSI
ncbi:MAG: ABC transporter substrate-binding protein, partial [Candidatus Thorarchaeota archaeon]